MMTITPNVPLRQLSTMRLGGVAAYCTEVHDRMEVLEALSWAQTRGLPVIMIGVGSNIVWRDEGFPGLIIINRILRYEVFEEDDLNVYVTAGAGENWDGVVARTAAAGLSGIECLSLVPGSAGATPVQNVGAYGQEISQTLATLEAFDTQVKDFVTLPAIDCGFGYRTSRFKTTDRGRFYITAITLHLSKSNPFPPFYGSLQNYLDEHKITEYTPQTIRDAVVAIRSSKLPDPAKVANTGSFFANPIINGADLVPLISQYPLMPHWQAGESLVKIPAAWLIEQAGFKGMKDPETGMATWPTQPLVLVNETAQSTADLLAFEQKVTAAVQAKFGVTLQREPELLP